MLKRLLNFTHTLHEIPILVLMPHSRCNCRCVMCDIWKANSEKKEISVEQLEPHLEAFKKLGVRRIALSGGEALMHPNLWRFCQLLKKIGVKISLLTTGVTLKNHVKEVVQYCDEVIVSLDGSREVHNRIRNIPGAFEKLEEGIKELRLLSPKFRIISRTVLQKQNFKDLPALIHGALGLKINQVSFLPADVSTEAFNRSTPWDEEKVSQVALTAEEVIEFESILQTIFLEFDEEFGNGFFAEPRSKMLDIAKYYRALLGGKFPEKKCNAPWVSAVVESNGDVMPCFFHKPYGNMNAGDFASIINSVSAVQFRKRLNTQKDAICRRCVCHLHIPVWKAVS